MSSTKWTSSFLQCTYKLLCRHTYHIHTYICIWTYVVSVHLCSTNTYICVYTYVNMLCIFKIHALRSGTDDIRQLRDTSSHCIWKLIRSRTCLGAPPFTTYIWKYIPIYIVHILVHMYILFYLFSIFVVVDFLYFAHWLVRLHCHCTYTHAHICTYIHFWLQLTFSILFYFYYYFFFVLKAFPFYVLHDISDFIFFFIFIIM